MSDYIPTKLVDDVLVRLLVESLIRFTSVCKSWYSIITSSSFIAKHLNHSKRRPENLLLATYTSIDKRERYMLCRGDDKFGDELDELEPPLSTSLGSKIIVGSCNGLVCMVDRATSPTCIILWNPLIRKLVTLPMPPCLPETKPLLPFVLGFGAHPTTHEYMLVFILYEWMDVKQQKFPSNVELYTQGTGSWRSIASVGHPHLSAYFGCLQAFVYGAIHWIALGRRVGDGLSSLIMSFNMGSQAFSQILILAALVIKSSLGLSILSYGESLAVLCRGQEGFCGMWVLKEYGVVESWAKLYTIPLTGVSGHIIGFRENGEVLESASDKQLLFYDCKTKTWTNTGYNGSSDAFTADTFMESLVLVKSRNGVFLWHLIPL